MVASLQPGQSSVPSRREVTERSLVIIRDDSRLFAIQLPSAHQRGEAAHEIPC